MLSVQRIAALCHEIGTDLHTGDRLRHRAIDAATALFLAIGSLERAMEPLSLPSHVSQQVQADLKRARTMLVGIEAVAHTLPEDELRQDVLRAREAVLTASTTMLGVAR
jgi:hypothetical protein